MKTNQVVEFVIDKELDITNHFRAFNSYKRNKERGFQQAKNETLEFYLTLDSEEKIREDIEKKIEKIYEKEDKLKLLAEDINKEWAKIENVFIAKLEEIHQNPFPYQKIKGVLSSASRFGYKIGEWFAVDMFKNKFVATDTAMHELMHFMFHVYFDKICEEKGLSKDKMWDVKESFTALLNLECSDSRFQPDSGYAPHNDLRDVIAKSWKENRDFNKTLERAIEFANQH